MVLRKKVIENFKTEKLQGSVTYTSTIIFPTFCVSVYTLYLIIICQVFDFFFFSFWNLGHYLKGRKKRGKREFKKTTLNREKKKKKEALHFFFLLWEVGETKEALYLSVLVYWKALHFYLKSIKFYFISFFGERSITL